LKNAASLDYLRHSFPIFWPTEQTVNQQRRDLMGLVVE